jgi:hypothetical protein
MALGFSKFKRLIGLFSVVSMLAASVAACACSHHAVENADAESSSCHSHHESQHDDPMDASGSRAESTVSETGCSCKIDSPRLVLRPENKQLQVQLVSTGSSWEPATEVSESITTSVLNFDTPFFFRSNLRSSTSDRAPPRLKSA